MLKNLLYKPFTSYYRLLIFNLNNKNIRFVNLRVIIYQVIIIIIIRVGVIEKSEGDVFISWE